MADAARSAVDALDGDVRSTLEAATVFRGVFDRHGFFYVCAPERSAGDANAALAELVDRSLVHADRSSGEVSFRLLGSIGRIVSADVTPEQVASLRTRVADSVSDFAEQAGGGAGGGGAARPGRTVVASSRQSKLRQHQRCVGARIGYRGSSSGCASEHGVRRRGRCSSPVRSGLMKDHPDDHLADKFGAMSAAEKIEWMIETDGWALEPVAADASTDPPTPAYAYTIGVPQAVGFSEVAVFGLTPVAAKGLLGLVVDACRGGTDIPLGIELTGLLDNDLRCLFAPVDLREWAPMFTTATSWYRGEGYELVQLVYPDRNGFMPYEAGFDQRMRYAQPVIGTVQTA